MITKAMADKISWLLVSIERAGLNDLVENCDYYLILKRMVETGSDLPEHVPRTDEEIQRSAEVYTMIHFWGVGTTMEEKARWSDFCEQWATA